MARSLKTIGVALSVLAGSVSAFTITPTALNSRATSTWGMSSVPTIDDLRRMSATALEAVDTPFPTTANMERSSSAKTRGAGPAILERQVVVEKKKAQQPVKEKKRMGSEAWEVRIYNDGMNTREFVARCLVQITGMSEFGAYQTMMQAHQNGIAVVGRYVYELAEMYHEALKKNGIVCDLVPVDEER